MSSGRLALAFLITASSAAVLLTGPAAAKEVGCKTLVNSVQKTGEAPRVTINKAKGMVRVEAAIGYCFETIDDWSARSWEKTSPVVVDKPPAKAPSAAPPVPQGTKPAPPPPRKARPKPTPIQPALPRPSEPCDQSLKGIWKSGWYSIGGPPYWLDSVYTIDLDGDSWTDNVGFRFKTDDGPDVVMRYFAATGQRTAKSFSALRVASESIIPRICFSRLVFGRPLSNVIKRKPFELPNLELEARTKRLERARAATKKNSVGILGMVLAVGAAFLVIGGGTGFFLWTRRKPLVGKDGDEEPLEDDA